MTTYTNAYSGALAKIDAVRAARRKYDAWKRVKAPGAASIAPVGGARDGKIELAAADGNKFIPITATVMVPMGDYDADTLQGTQQKRAICAQVAAIMAAHPELLSVNVGVGRTAIKADPNNPTRPKSTRRGGYVSDAALSAYVHPVEAAHAGRQFARLSESVGNKTDTTDLDACLKQAQAVAALHDAGVLADDAAIVALNAINIPNK